ncbi:GGDEF domain-containing protein [Paenibacillus chartarius]|uniref:GGDEF domain-containing protein n=1 Tax=Paenibacillus chartarius TaxID=747481 RepID=A0ABV6DJB5_9BACL
MQEWMLPISNVCMLVTLNYIAIKLRSKWFLESYEIVAVPVLTGLASIILMLLPLPSAFGIIDLRFAPIVMAGLCFGMPICVLSMLLPAAFSFWTNESDFFLHLCQNLLAPSLISALFHNRDYRTGFQSIRLSDGFRTLLLFFIAHVLIGYAFHPVQPTVAGLMPELYMLILCSAAIVILIKMYNDDNKAWLLQRQLELQANQDGLTRLANLRSFMRLAEDTISRRRIAIFMIDIDNFKRYNDRFGHLAGDELLREVGQVLRHTIAEEDYVARYGGEEFILLSHYTDPETLSAYAGKLCQAVCEQVRSEYDRVPDNAAAADKPGITISVGISVAARPGAVLGQLIAEADEALYASKKSGKNRFTFHLPAASSTG